MNNPFQLQTFESPDLQCLIEEETTQQAPHYILWMQYEIITQDTVFFIW